MIHIPALSCLYFYVSYVFCNNPKKMLPSSLVPSLFVCLPTFDTRFKCTTTHPAGSLHVSSHHVAGGPEWRSHRPRLAETWRYEPLSRSQYLSDMSIHHAYSILMRHKGSHMMSRSFLYFLLVLDVPACLSMCFACSHNEVSCHMST